jgi:hypothetical protein
MDKRWEIRRVIVQKKKIRVVLQDGRLIGWIGGRELHVSQVQEAVDALPSHEQTPSGIASHLPDPSTSSE